MTSKLINARLTITRSSDDRIRLTILDNTSRIEFFSGVISPEQMMLALTSIAERPFTLATLRGAEHVGLVPIRKRCTVECPLPGYRKREELEAWLRDNVRHEGWIVVPYLGSQHSVTTGALKDGPTKLHYTIIKYVEPNSPEAEAKEADA